MCYIYCDTNNEKIIKYVREISKKYSDIDLINRVYFDIKNSIYYDPYSNYQKASETLVMGRGDNFSKNVLFYTLMKSLGFESYIENVRVKDNTMRLISRKNTIVNWSYVRIVLFGENIVLDVSFDKMHLIATQIKCKSKFGQFSAEDYYVEDKRLFELIPFKISKQNDLFENNELKLVNTKICMDCPV